MNRVEHASLRARQIKGWKSSGLAVRAYCERESIGYETFRRWRRRLAQAPAAQASAPRLVPVRLAQAPERAARGVVARDGADVLAEPVEIVLASGRRLRFSGGLDETGLGRLIRLLEVLPCSVAG
jgi:hypothetical protein